MAKQSISIGTTPNDGTGDTIRSAFNKANQNFTELYDRYRTAVPTSATATGTPGQYAADASYFYICTAANTWRRVALSTW